MTATDRRALLYAALAAVLVKRRTPALALVHCLLDSWRGIGFIVVGMLRQGFDLSLVSYPQGWLATFLHRNHVLHPLGWSGDHVLADSLAGGPIRCVAGVEHSVRQG